MTKFKLEVELDNAEFVGMGGEFDSANLESILRGVIEALENDDFKGATLRDWNGNTVGNWTIQEGN